MVRRNSYSRSAFSVLDDLRADYDAAKDSRFQRRRRGVTRMGRSADWHTRASGEGLYMTEKARDVYRNEPIVGQAIDRASINKIQGGIPLDPMTGDMQLDSDLKAAWSAWCNNPAACDVQGERTFQEMEEGADTNCAVDGDLFFLPTTSGALEAVEYHRCRNPVEEIKDFHVVEGIVLDNKRRRTQYWFTENDVDPFENVNRSALRPIDARDSRGNRQVFHVYDPKRFSQTRGVTVLARLFDTASMIGDTMFAKQVQQSVACSFAIVRERDRTFGGGAAKPLGPDSTDQINGKTRQIEEIYPGMEFIGDIGEKLKLETPNMQNADFLVHVRLMLTLIGINLGLPLILVMLDASETNFSSWRGVIDEARRQFRRNQRWLTQKLHTPTYEWQLRRWISRDAALRSAQKRLGQKLFAHQWHLPGWPYIEPIKDAAGDLLLLKNVMTSPRRYHASRGQEWSDVYSEAINDNGQAIRAAMKEAIAINANAPAGQEVHWRELLSLPAPDGLTLSINTGADEADNTTGTAASGTRGSSGTAGRAKKPAAK
jgi:lambda family phage portal protein